MKSLQDCAHENHELILKYLLYSFNSTDINSHPFRQGKEGNGGENESLEVHKNKFYKFFFLYLMSCLLKLGIYLWILICRPLKQLRKALKIILLIILFYERSYNETFEILIVYLTKAYVIAEPKLLCSVKGEILI